MLRTALLLACLATPALAENHLPAITVEDAVIYATSPTATTAGGYVTITNESDTAYTLTGVEAGFPTAELHESLMDGDVMRMEPRPEGFEVAPGEVLKLERGGRHVMFMGLERPLKPGTDVKGTLIFTDEVRIPVTFEVRRPGDAPAAEHGDTDHSSH
ncbi:copper chaperone PCu(A)C [Palleronia sp.]|uniref:copper chaperone PCu(A)C n=1 Tax=Palleronia sp. TaxID=1940284 RepID=UPI0035C7F7B7